MSSGSTGMSRWFRYDPYRGFTLLVLSIFAFLMSFYNLYTDEFKPQLNHLIFSSIFLIIGVICLTMLIRRIRARGLRRAFDFDTSGYH